MRVTNPQEPYKGIAPENVFVALNDLGVQAGSGYVHYQYQPTIYPDRPVNIYFDMKDCLPEAEYLIFGALVARARQMHTANSQGNARLYTNVEPGDSQRLSFYLHNGMTVVNTEDEVRLQIPQMAGPELFGCTIIQPALNTVAEQQALAERLQLHGFPYRLEYLQWLRTQPGFHVWGILYQDSLVGECVVAGVGASAELAAIYVVPQYQNRGIGKYLLHRALSIIGQEGVTEVTARIMSASQPQVHLMRAFGAELVRQTTLFPGIEINS